MKKLSRLAARRAASGGKRASTAVLIALLFLLTGCGFPDRVSSANSAAAIPSSARIQTADAAVAVVRRATKRRGRDPNASEYHARRIDNEWSVLAWHIWYPENSGESRFVPGGFTSYTVSDAGKILQVMPGL
ncbi:MAG TPA: hypothetical protein VF593_04350 [Chthoniobacteraceae bacterium]|jgi:hypothetical protein